jgi:hypothetical protein
MELLRRHFKATAEDEAWISPLATALQSAQVIYLVGSLFVGIAFQPFVWMLIAVQIGFDSYVGRRYPRSAKRPFVKPKPEPAPAA